MEILELVHGQISLVLYLNFQDLFSFYISGPTSKNYFRQLNSGDWGYSIYRDAHIL